MPIELSATKEAGKAIEKAGQAGALTTRSRNELAEKLAKLGLPSDEKSAIAEGKAPGVFGVDLNNGVRTMFILDNNKNPVLIYAGDHDGYMELSKESKNNPKAFRERFLAKDTKIIEFDSKKNPTPSIKQSDFKDMVTKSLQKLRGVTAVGAGAVASVVEGNRNFKGPFCLDRKVPKNPEGGQFANMVL